MRKHINGKMKFELDMSLLLTVFTRFPFTLVVYFYACGINNDVGDSSLTRQKILNFYDFLTLTNVGVCREFQPDFHQRKNLIKKAF